MRGIDPVNPLALINRAKLRGRSESPGRFRSTSICSRDHGGDDARRCNPQRQTLYRSQGKTRDIFGGAAKGVQGMNGDSLFWNKIIGSVLLAALIAMTAGLVSRILYEPHDLEKPAYAIGGGDGGSGAKEEAAKAAAAKGAAGAPQPIAALLAAADPARGQKAAKKCAACHSFDKGGRNKVGPNLWDVVGREKASVAGFKYSTALKEKGGKWTYEDLNRFLLKPKDYAKGTKMTFAGIKKAADRANVIAFLRSRSDSPRPLP